MKNITLKAVVVFLFVALTGSFFAQQGRMMQGKKGQMCQEMKLSDDQLKKIQTLRIEHQEYAVDIRTEMQKNRLAIKKLMLNDNFDENELLNLSRANSDLQAKIKDSKLKMKLDVYKLLNADQKKIWKKRFLQMGKKMHRVQKAMKRGKSQKFQKRQNRS
ncbi:MAG: Spy/CpxP family protein refolding chaperone [Rhodothermaceae bacterium]